MFKQVALLASFRRKHIGIDWIINKEVIEDILLIHIAYLFILMFTQRP